MYPWGDAPTVEPPAYAVGSAVYSGDCRGTVVAVDAEQATLGIVWSDGDGPITYPIEAPFLRKAHPWE